jgi:hypothetical protein
LNIEDCELDVLGSADKVIISKDDTIIMGGSGEKKNVEDRVS